MNGVVRPTALCVRVVCMYYLTYTTGVSRAIHSLYIVLLAFAMLNLNKHKVELIENLFYYTY